jgi:transposase
MKQCISADISKAELVCRCGFLDENHKIKLGPKAIFNNDQLGIKKMYDWAKKNLQATIPCIFVMEATGVYHEHLAHFLFEHKEQVCVELPRRAKKYAQSLPQQSKTDSIDADMLCQMGLERELGFWSPPEPIYRKLRALTRELADEKKEYTRLSNKLSALRSSYAPEKSIMNRLTQKIKKNKQVQLKISQQIQQEVQKHPDLEQTVNRLATIPGAAAPTIITVLAETNGFSQIKNRKQLASFVGLDILHNQSGTFSGKARISKKGNTHLRKTLFMPALSAVKCNPAFMAIHQRIKAKTAIGKKGIIAVARKLLLLIYTLWKNGQSYNPQPPLATK